MRILTIVVAALLASAATAEDKSLFKLGIGTDASLGLAFGAEYQVPLTFGSTQLYVGPAVYYSRWTETTESINTYTETSSTWIAGVALGGEAQPSNDDSLSLIYGVGAAFMLNNWQETSPGDSSIGPLVDGLYTDAQETSGASVFFNAGIRKDLTSALAIEFNVPVFLVPYYYGTALAPAFVISGVFSL